MAAADPTSIRIDLWLDAIKSMLDDLPGLAHEWHELDDGERMAWCLDWDQAMLSHLPWLAHASGERWMSSTQLVRYAALLDSLAKALPTVQQLGLSSPPELVAQRAAPEPR